MNLAKMQAIARLVMELGDVTRATFHPDGKTPETDTTHTVMIALFAIELCPPELDLGHVLSLAIVHDLVEAKAGDTVTARPLDAQAQAEKEARENEGHDFICTEVSLRLGLLIAEHMNQQTPASRFVHALDKMLPSLTHSLNGGASPKALGINYEELVQLHLNQHKKLHGEEPEFPWLAELYMHAAISAENALLHDAVERLYKPSQANGGQDGD